MSTRALIALTSRDRVARSGRRTGVWASELADAWDVLTGAGLEVDLVSVNGGKPPLEAVDLANATQGAFFGDAEAAAKLDSTRPAWQVDPRPYSLLFLAGGHGAVEDYPDDPGTVALARAIYEQGGVVAAVCHGPAVLVSTVLTDGSYLVAGKRVSCFTNEEERAVGMLDAVPFLLADRLVERGAIHDAAPSFMPHVVSDGRLVTGQNPPSARGVAEAAVSALRLGSPT